MNEEFSITVPNSSTVKQGAELIVTVALNRGPYFKQDVVLAVHTEGIGVTPDRVTVRASDLPVVRLRVLVPREAAIGMYRVSVVGMPQAGRTASTEFTVEVVPQ